MIKTKRQGIKDYSVGETFNDFLIIKGVRSGKTRAGKTFLTVSVGDSTEELPMMVWDNVDAFLEKYKPEDIIKVNGTINEYQGNRQLNFVNIRLKDEDDEIDVSDLLQSAPIQGSDLLQEIDNTIEELENNSIKKITKKIVERHRDKLETYPAARGIHHAYVSGLAYHTVEMLRIAKSLAKLYSIVNRDLLLAGVILHDLKKTEEYTGVVAPEMTLKGRLIGHISMISEEIGYVAKELKIEGEEVMLLQHLVLSHHGKLEWSSPVVGMTAEAILLHKCDLISARMDTIKSELDNVNEGELTDRVFALDNRQLYKHKL